MTDDVGKDSVDDLVSDLVTKAGSVEKSGDIQLAVVLLSEAALADPGNETVGGSLFSIAQDYLFQKNYKAALPIFDLIRALYEEDDLGEYGYVLFDSGTALVELGELDQGEVLLRAGLEYDPENPWFLRLLGYFLLNQRKYEEGIAFLKEANEIEGFEFNEEFIESLEAIAWAEFKLGRNEEALEVLFDNFALYLEERILDIYLDIVRLLDNQPAVEALKQLEEKLQELEEEDQSIESALDYLSNDYYYELARRYQRLGKKEKALEYFLSLISSENPSYLVGLGRAFLEFGEDDLALKYADRAAALAPEDPFPEVLRAKAFLLRKDYPATLQAVENGLSMAMEGLPKTIQEESGQYTTDKFTAPGLKEGEGEQKREENDPRPELFLAKADALTGLERYEEALQTLSQAMYQFPTKIIFYRYAAALLLKMGKPEQARAHFDAAHKARAKLDAPSKKLIKKIKAALTQ